MPHRTHQSRRRFGAALAAMVLAAGGLTACSSDDGPDDTLSAFLTGWHNGDLQKINFVTANGGAISAADTLTQLRNLSGDLAKQPPAVTPIGTASTSGDISSRTIKVEWTLPGGAVWSYQSTVRLTKKGDKGWQVIWEPALVQSTLETSDKLRLRRVSPPRAAILDNAGQPLVTPRDVVTVGVTPQNITDVSQLQQDLTAAFKTVAVTLDLSTLPARIKTANKTAFLDLVTLRRPDYDKISDSLKSLPGVVFREDKRDLAPSRAFARALLGTADEATRDDINKFPDTIAQGDIIGHGGLQQQYDVRLRGTPGQSVVIARTAPDNTVSDTPLFSTPAVPGRPVKTSLDVATQNAADRAVATEKQLSSMIVIKVSDGSVLAVANGPDGGTVDTALTGKVPPGSTFKTVTAYGVLANHSVEANTVVNCPQTLTVAGRDFKNANGEVLGSVPFHVNYAKSCNTAFASLAPQLGAAGLKQASTAMGLGLPWDLGIDAFSGKVSAGDSPTELAAAAFGQGTTVVSPLAMASVAASVARGQFKQPRLVLDPAPAKPVADGASLDPTSIEALRVMMREVVTDGTGVALKSVRGTPVRGKTGTAEFDSNSTDTHSWFIGYQGGLAFAVMVQKGGAGSEAAVPIVANFLTTINK